ncbi:hypothetical protein BGZ76_000934, partial [Entomortierella beljakovae]
KVSVQQKVPPISKTSAFLPPRPPVLDRLSHLSSRQTLKDSIAASIAASASTNRNSSESTIQSSASDISSQGQGQGPTFNTTGSPSFNKKSYMPWSREQFHERLETFKPSTWFDKPNAVNPVECAKRGWINKGNDRLECYGGCGGVVIVRIDLDQDNSQRAGDHTSTDDKNGESIANSEDSDIEMGDPYIEYGVEATGPNNIT